MTGGLLETENYLRGLVRKHPNIFKEPLGESEDEFDAIYNCLECARKNFVDKEMVQILVDSCLKKDVGNILDNATKVFCQEIDKVYIPLMIGNFIYMDDLMNNLPEYLLGEVRNLEGFQASCWLNTLDTKYIEAF